MADNNAHKYNSPKEEQLCTEVDAEFDQALGADDTEISHRRAKAMNDYLAKGFPEDDPDDGMSKLVAQDTANAVDGIMPVLLQMFTNRDNLITFMARNANDEAQAAQEADCVTSVIFDENPAFLIFNSWFFDACLQMVGIVKCFWDERPAREIQTYHRQNPLQVEQLEEDKDLTILEAEEYEEEINVGPPGSPPMTVTYTDIVAQKSYARGRITIEPVAPENYRISSDASSLDPRSARMVGEERRVTRSELVDLGFDKDVIWEIPTDHHRWGSGSEERLARRDTFQEQEDSPYDTAMEKVLLRECFIRSDYDEDGIAELRHVIKAGNKILQNILADRPIYHTLCPVILPHKHFGKSLYDKVKDLQEASTVVLRGTMDNVYRSSIHEHILNEFMLGDDTIEQFLSTRVGGIKTVEGDPNAAHKILQTPYTANQTFQMLEWLKKEGQERTGISSDSQGITPESLKHIQTGVLSQALNIAQLKQQAICRSFACTGLESLAMHVHELLRKHQDIEKEMKIRDDWVQVKPQEWDRRENVRVNVGLGIGTKEQNLLHLEAIWAKQKDIVQAGGLQIGLLTPENLWNTSAELVKNASLQHPEKFFTKPPPDAMQKLQQQGEANPQAEALKMQVEIEKEKALREMEKLELEHEKQLWQRDKEIAQLALDKQRFELEAEKAEMEGALALEKLRNEIEELRIKKDNVKVQAAQAASNMANQQRATVQSNGNRPPPA